MNCDKRHPLAFGRRLHFEPLENRRLLAVITVDTPLDLIDANDGHTSLREAVISANGTGAADTINFEIDHTTSPSTSNTLGTKGVGEAGTIASTPAVVNAVVDAVRQFGINDIQMPCTPERVWTALQGAGSGAATVEDAMPHFEAEEGQQ